MFVYVLSVTSTLLCLYRPDTDNKHDQ